LAAYETHLQPRENVGPMNLGFTFHTSSGTLGVRL